VTLPGLLAGLERVGFEWLAARLADLDLPERLAWADGRTRAVRRTDFGLGFPIDRPLRRLVGFLEWLDLDRTAMMDDAGRVHPDHPNTVCSASAARVPATGGEGPRSLTVAGCHASRPGPLPSSKTGVGQLA
jgi:hypothetical protein